MVEAARAIEPLYIFVVHLRQGSLELHAQSLYAGAVTST
jgi:hypothetical protein